MYYKQIVKKNCFGLQLFNLRFIGIQHRANIHNVALQQKQPIMKKLLLLLIFTVFYIINTNAQNGAIQGTLVDNYGIYVPGAAVLLNPANKGAVSDQNGKFTFVDVPNGSYTVIVKYLGFEDKKMPVTVAEGKTVAVSVVLSPSELVLEDVEVFANSLSGQARALNTQKNNPNITNVVSTEQIGKFPDANIGDAVKRIPGITMQVDQGEARNIIVRGLAPQLNSVTLNGSRIPSAEGDNRNVQMDLIPSDMIQTIEVNKAVTPDMDADALGGSVNLITRSTPQDFRLSATVGSGVNTITDKRILNGSFLIGDRSSDKKFGWMLSASINDNDFGSDNVEAEWSDKFEYNTGVQDGSGDDILEGVDVKPYASVFEIREYLVQRVRRSFSANMDYHFDANNYVFVKTMYNWRDDRENRFRQESEILDGDDIGLSDFEVQNGNLVRFPVESKRETKGGIAGKRTKNRRLEDQRMQNYSLGGEHLFGKIQVEWLGSYAKASEKRPNERYIAYESEYEVENGTNTRKPLYTAVNQSDLDLTNFDFDELTEENQDTYEEDYNFFANFTLPADLFGNGDGTFKFGIKTRYKNKTRSNNFFEYDPTSGFGTLADVTTKDYSDADFSAGKGYLVGTFTTAEFLGSLNLNTNNFDAEDLPEEYLTANFDVKESVNAAYVMANQKLSDRLSVLAGLRIETTKTESAGNEVSFDENGDFDPDATIVAENENSYVNIMPGVHFKYDMNDKTVLRLAWTNTLARPNYVDLVSYREINNEDEEILLGNPELDPTTSVNFDFMAEHYFKNVGVLSGGVFFKNIKDFVYTYTSEDTNGYDVFQPLNGDNAQVYGAEVSIQRQLDFLPGFAKNFGVYANYTYLNSTAKGIRNEDGDERGNMDLPGAAPHMLNGSLSYSGKRFSARISANFSDAYLDELGGDSFEDRYYDQQFFLDFNASFAVSKNLRVYADITNITNQPLRYYQGVSSRTMQMEYYRTRINVGLKYDLF